MSPADAFTAARVPSAAASKSEGRAERIRIEQHGPAGMLWLAGWLFTIGFLHLPFWQALLALIIWPYYIGAAVSGVLS